MTMFRCNECGLGMTAERARRSLVIGCPDCGGFDIGFSDAGWQDPDPDGEMVLHDDADLSGLWRDEGGEG